MKITIPNKFKPLFLPNRSAEEQKKFTQKHKDDLRNRLLRGEELSPSEIGIKEFILRGGRVSGKTKNDELATIPLLDNIERGDVWYCRSEDSTIRRTIFQSFQAELHELGYTLSNRSDSDFKISFSPFEIKHNRSGNTVQFFAINKDINRTKGKYPPSGVLKKVILEEANEPDDESFVEALKSTALRFMDEKGKIVYRYNPPPSLNAWANRYFSKKAQNGATLIHSTWRDIAELLEPSVISQILEMKKTDPLHYAYWYGGEVVNLAGRVIWTFDRAKHLLKIEEMQRRMSVNLFYQPTAVFYGVDSGLKNDATAVSCWAVYPDGGLIKLDTFYLDIKEARRNSGLKGISHTDQVQLIVAWYNDFLNKMKNLGVVIPAHDRERWCFDGAGLTQDLMFEFEKATASNCVAVTDKDIERDIARLVNAYRSGQLLILDTEANAVSVNELESFSRNEENEIPEGQSDHTIDADKYATYEYYYNFL